MGCTMDNITYFNSVISMFGDLQSQAGREFLLSSGEFDSVHPTTVKEDTYQAFVEQHFCVDMTMAADVFNRNIDPVLPIALAPEDTSTLICALIPLHALCVLIGRLG